MVEGGGVVAEGELLPDIQEELGVAGPAEEEVAEEEGALIVGGAGEAHAKLPLGDIHALPDHLGLLPGAVALRHRDGGDAPAGQGGEGVQQGVLHPGELGAAAVEELHGGGGDQAAVLGVELLGGGPLHGLLVPQAADAVGLPGAELLQEAEVRPVPLVVADGADGVRQVVPLALHVVREEAAAAGDGLEDHLAQELRHGLQELLAAESVGVVNETAHEAHALALALLADGVVQLGAVEPVQPGADGPHVRRAHGAPAEHRRQQGPDGGAAPVQRRQEMGAQEPGFELSRREVGEADPLHQFLANHNWPLPRAGGSGTAEF